MIYYFTFCIVVSAATIMGIVIAFEAGCGLTIASTQGVNDNLLFPAL